MSPNQFSFKTPLKQRGSMLVIALFVIIVLAFLAYAMIRITNISADANVYEVYGARALNAANSGVERALNEIFMPTGGVSSVQACSAFPKTYDLSTVGVEFSGCNNITVNCGSFLVTQTGFTHFQLESTASCVAGEFTTQRSVAVEARD